eukprot:UN04590
MNKVFEENEVDWITFKINNFDGYPYYPVSVSFKSCHEHNYYNFSSPKAIKIEFRAKVNAKWIDLFHSNLELKREFGMQTFEILHEQNSKEYFHKNPIDMVRISLIDNYGQSQWFMYKFILYEIQL